MIEQLTPEQEAKMQDYVDMGIAIGLDTSPIDKEKASAAIDKAYECAGLTPPENKIFAGSPMAGLVISAGILKGSVNLDAIDEEPGNGYIKVMRKELSRDDLHSALRESCYGSQDSGWFMMIQYFKEAVGLEGLEIADGLIEATKECGRFWMFDDVAVISAKPSAIRRDDENRLHSESSLAIEYPDGWGFCVWHGTRIPAAWILEEGHLTAEMAITWENIEQRRAACELLGWEAILDKLDAKVINRHDDPMIGELIEVDIPDIGKEKFLRVLCGTGRFFALPMPPHVNTALEANAWSYDISPEELDPEVRT